MTASIAAGAGGEPRRRLLPRLLRVVAVASCVLVLGLWALFLVGAFYFDLTLYLPRGVTATAFVLVLAFGVWRTTRWRRWLFLVGSCLLAQAWWLTLAPSHDREWAEDKDKLPYAVTAGDVVTLHNVRDGYFENGSYDPGYHDRQIRLSRVAGVDLLLNYWGSPWLAHPIFSFRFRDGPPICISIETRNERGEAYSSLAGVYRQYELVYVVSTERDAVLARTAYRENEDSYLFRLAADPTWARDVLRSYLETINDLHDEPRFYNALTSNCTTNIDVHTSATGRAPDPWDWRVLLPGKLHELIAKRGGFASSLPVEELKRFGRINRTANEAGRVEDFWKRIRHGVPGFEEF